MARFLISRNKAKGQIPGSPIFIGEQKMEKPRIRVIDFSPDHLVEKELSTVDESYEHLDSGSVTWLNIDGLHETNLIQAVAEYASVHNLIIEDILNTDNRPKFVENEKSITIIVKLISYDLKVKQLKSEQISLILGENYLITLQERVGDVFDPVRERIRNSTGRIRANRPDYLAYALLDSIVDSYFSNIELIGEVIEGLEANILEQPNQDITKEIYQHKMEINFLRKSIRPMIEVVNHILKSENTLIKSKTTRFFKDLEDLVLQAAESVEIYHSMISDQLNIYNTNISNRANEVMRTLTVFAAVFIPLTFLAGVYGTNFEYLPEIKFKYGYLFFWIVIIVFGLSLVMYFKRKKWL